MDELAAAAAVVAMSIDDDAEEDSELEDSPGASVQPQCTVSRCLISELQRQTRKTRAVFQWLEANGQRLVRYPCAHESRTAQR